MKNRGLEPIAREGSMLWGIENYLKLRGIPIDKFFDSLLSQLPYVGDSHFNQIKLLRKDLNELPILYSEVAKSTTPLPIRKYLGFIRLLHHVFNFDIDEFKVPHHLLLSTEFNSYLNKKHRRILTLETSDKKSSNPVVDYSETYLDAFEAHLKSMSKELVVNEYLEYLDNKDPDVLDSYYLAHEKLYELIERRLSANQSFNYTRFLSLPVHHKLSLLKSPHKGEERIELLIEVLKICSVPLYIHITNCMAKWHERFDKSDAGFFLVPRPSRAYQWALIDEGKLIVSEYYRYTGENKCAPALLVLEEKNIETLPIYESYDFENKALKSTKRFINPRIHLRDLNKLDLEAIFNKHIQTLETEVSLLDSDNDRDEIARKNKDVSNTKLKLEHTKKSLLPKDSLSIKS